MKLFWLLLLTAPAFADPVVAQVGIIDGAHESQMALAIAENGEAAELSVSGPISTKLKLRKLGQALEFDVEQVASDHSMASFRAHGEVALPPTGKRVTVARVPRPQGGSAEVQLTLK